MLKIVTGGSFDFSIGGGFQFSLSETSVTKFQRDSVPPPAEEWSIDESLRE
jgi:hypothetical protein